MVSIRNIQNIALASFLALFIGYKSIDNYIDKNLNTILDENWYAPEWVTYIPGKSDEILDIYLEQMKDHYETTPFQTNYNGFCRAILFSREKAPERVNEVYSKIVCYLIEKSEFNDALDYAWWYKGYSDNDSLINKVKSYSK